ncbi:hypothetical protein EUX98_g7454 [Antrodiella citrinella]|uniref:AB hydrolase-1 domain-containing protein n=1 Tax=Antrodiella citrinella TaxID=2447956 RepID=A0A4S4MLG2_9APHY|nr:hypothetical protein EUX98_g7454 [Antrodiella citrinella]
MTSSFASLLEQEVYTVPSFTLDSGRIIRDVPVAYKTWGKLNETKDNIMIICHAFTGSADVEDWWGPLMGRGKAFDANRYFIFCGNVMGSPYGSASPVTINPDTGKPYGPEFPATTIRDDPLSRWLLGVPWEGWPYWSGHYARHQVIWGEAQRQSIYSDPGYEDGYYSSQPASGLAAARMAALLTYRSRDSFESRFGRKPQQNAEMMPTPPRSPNSTFTSDDCLAEHNDGSKNTKSRTPLGSSTPSRTQSPAPARAPIFSAQSYLRYQGDKFTARFDANCYIHITRKLDTHDVSRGRQLPGEDEFSALARVLGAIPPRALVIGVQTDGLFTPNEQRELAEHIPDAELVIIPSPEGHDGFLLEFELINGHIMGFLKREFPEFYRTTSGTDVSDEPEEGFDIKKTSLFGEAEADIVRW